MTFSSAIPALIGASVAIITLIIRDIFLPSYNENRNSKRSEEKLYEEYARPIAVSLQDLMWRLDEIVNKPGRGAYLTQPSGSSNYAEYKRISTVYRLAVVIAWFRGFERELMSLRSAEIKKDNSLTNAMMKFKSVLADGKSIEIQRLEKAMLAIGAELTSQTDKENLALKIENILEDELGSEKSKGVKGLSTHKADSCIDRIIFEISKYSSSSVKNDQLSGSTRRELIDILSIHQTWIYRDWQSAIGDEMLVPEDKSPRRFTVMGFGKFEELWSGDMPIWIRRLSGIFIDFDPHAQDSNDARRDQINSLMITTSELIISLANSDPSIEKAMEATILKARSIKTSQ